MSESVKQANKTRAQKAREAHEKASKQRKNDQQTIKAAYLSGKGDLIIEDLLVKIPLWQKLHLKVAQDGVGIRPTGFKLTNGEQEVENIYLTPDQRASHLDKSAGLQEILDYIERQTTVPKPDIKPKSKQKAV